MFACLYSHINLVWSPKGRNIFHFVILLSPKIVLYKTFFLYIIILHIYTSIVLQIWKWRIISASHLWTWRWLSNPRLEVQSLEQWGRWKSVVIITADDALWRWSLAAVSFRHWASLKVTAASWIVIHQRGQSLAHSSNSMGLSLHPWRFAFTVSLYHFFFLNGLGFSCHAGALCTADILANSAPPCRWHARPNYIQYNYTHTHTLYFTWSGLRSQRKEL